MTWRALVARPGITVAERQRLEAARDLRIQPSGTACSPSMDGPTAFSRVRRSHNFSKMSRRVSSTWSVELDRRLMMTRHPSACIPRSSCPRSLPWRSCSWAGCARTARPSNRPEPEFRGLLALALASLISIATIERLGFVLTAPHCSGSRRGRSTRRTQPEMRSGQRGDRLARTSCSHDYSNCRCRPRLLEPAVAQTPPIPTRAED